MSDKTHKSRNGRPDAASGKPRAGAPDAPREPQLPPEPLTPGGRYGPADAPQAAAGQPRSEAGAEPAPRSGWSQGEIEALKSDNEELRDRVLRVAAEMENLRRRTEREKTDMARYAISNFARDVLTIADNIQRAIDHVPEGAAEKDPALKSFLEGVEVTERELYNVMERHGIVRLDPAGERFDPNMHQAMFEVADPAVPEGTVVQVAQPGYKIADRVLRPALVGVSKGGAKAPKEAPAAAAANDDGPRGRPGRGDDVSGDGPGDKPGDGPGDGPGDKPGKDGPAAGGAKLGGHVDKNA